MRSSEGLYYRRLDHVRAFAVFLVFFWHWVHLVWIPPSYVPSFFMVSVFEEGHCGVSLFMTLSGYLFAKILHGRQVMLTAFYWNRFIRLAPMLGATLLYCGIFLGASFDSFIRGFIFPTWVGPLWSLGVELHFYLILPFLLLISRIGGVAALAATIVVVVLFRAGWWWHFGSVQVLAYSTIFGRFDQFVLGIIFARVSERPAFRARAIQIFVAVVLSFAVIYHLFNTAGGYAGLFASPLWIVLPTIEGTFFACAIAGYEAIPGITVPWLSAAAARVGEVSYSIYLTHYFLMMWVLRRIGRYIPANTDFPTISIIAVALFPFFVGYAMITYGLIEKPFLRFRRPYAKAAAADAIPAVPNRRSLQDETSPA